MLGDETPEVKTSSPRQRPCLTPDNNEIARPRAPKRTLPPLSLQSDQLLPSIKPQSEDVSPKSPREPVQAGSAVSLEMLNDFYLSRWTDQEILDTNLTEGQRAHLEGLDRSTPLLLRKAYEMQHREMNLRTFRQSELNGKIPKRFLCNSNGGIKRRRLDNGNTFGDGFPTRDFGEGILTIFGEGGLPMREEAIHQIDRRTPIVRTLDQILTALVMKQASRKNGHQQQQWSPTMGTCNNGYLRS